MPIAPRLGTADDTKITLTFDSGVTDLSNIDYHAMTQDVIHKVQTKSDALMGKSTYVPFEKGTFKWQFLTDKRDPTKRTKAIPDIASKAQTFEAVGLTLDGYDDDSYVVDFVQHGTQVSLSSTIFESMYYGYQRLLSKLILSAMVQPRIKRNTASSDRWKTGEVARAEVDLPTTQYGGKVTGSGSSFKLVGPTHKTIQAIKKKIWDTNADRSMKICSVLTPQMEVYMEDMAQYFNNDYIWAATKEKIDDPSVKSIFWYGVYWVKITPEVAMTTVYNNRFMDASAGPGEFKTTVGTAAANDVDLGDGSSSSQAYEVIPFWTPSNIRWASNPGMAMSKMYLVPYKKLVPVISMTEWLGATRMQDELQVNLIIPKQ